MPADDKKTSQTSIVTQPTESPKPKKKTLILIVVFAVLAKALLFGSMKCISIYFLPFQEDLEAKTREAALVRALLFGFLHLSAPLSTVLCNLLGYKKTLLIGSILISSGVAASSWVSSIYTLYVTLGVCAGIGSSLINIPVLALIGQIFTTKRPLVNNLLSIGPSIIAGPLAIVVQYWIDVYTWRGSILLLSNIIMQTIPAVLILTLQAKNTHVKIKSNSKQKLFDLSLLKNGYFLIFAFAAAMHIACFTLINTYLVRYAQDLGINDYKAASLFTMINTVEIFLKPTVGFALSRQKIGRFNVNRLMVYIGIMLFTACTTFSIPYARTFPMLSIATLVYSIGTGCLGALPITILAELFGPKNLLNSLGLRSVLVGSFVMATPPLAGLLVDITGNFTVPFYASSCLAVMCSILLIVIQIKFKPKQ